MISFTIPGTLPTMNEIVAASKKNHMAYANMKKDYTALVMISAQGLPKVSKADFIITWYCENKRKDPDNIAGGGIKMILDGLVKAGVIPNDGWSEINSITHHFEVDKQNPRIEIKIFELIYDLDVPN
jgi:Holliday junction resolvase RusA-like endonuclease